MGQYHLKLPKMGESVTEATVTKWLLEVGDTIQLDDSIVEIATDKVDNELPSEAEGVLVEQLFSSITTSQYLVITLQKPDSLNYFVDKRNQIKGISKSERVGTIHFNRNIIHPVLWAIEFDCGVFNNSVGRG